MAKLTSTQVFGDLGVSNIISCKNLYIDENGNSDSYGLTIGDITSDVSMIMNTSGMLLSITSTTANYVSAFINPNNGKQHSVFGAGLDDDTNKRGHIKVGTSGASDAARFGVIEYTDSTDATTGELRVNVPSSNGALKVIVGTNTGITVTENGIILCGGTEGITFGTGVESLAIAQDGTISIKSDLTSTSNMSLSGTVGVGLNTGSTSADTRVYFGTNANYIQYDNTALDNGGALQMTKPFNPLKEDTTPAEVEVGKDGFLGPQIGWQPEWFDDFTRDTESEYTFSGGYAAGYPNINTNTSVLQLRGAKRTTVIPGAFTGYAFDIPLKSDTIYTSRNRYLAMRYRNRTTVGEPPFSSGYVSFITSDDSTYDEDKRVYFDLQTATTRTWYELWLDMQINSGWPVDITTTYVTGLQVYLYDPFDGGITSGNPQIGIDWLGVGHRAYEPKFSSSDMYYWGNVEIEGNLTVSGSVTGIDFSEVSNTAHTHDFSVITNTAHTHSEYYSSGDDISATTLTATTIVRPNGVLRHKFNNCSEIGSTFAYNNFSSNYAQGRMFIALTHNSSSAITQFYLPSTYISGTQITFDYGWVEGTSSPVGPGTRDMYWLASAHPMALEGVDDPTEGQFRSYTLSQTGWTETYSAYSQNMHRVSGIKFTDENGAINGRTVIPGDLIALSMAGLGGTMSSTAWYPMFIQFNYYAEE